MVVKRGITVWISAFVTFLAILSSFAMVVLLVNEGVGSIVRPYILGSIFGDLSAETYLWISVTTTFIFLGITCIIAYRKQPPKPEIVKMFLKVGGNLAALRKAQDASITEVADQLEYERKVNQKFFNKVNSNFEETNKETLALLAEQRKTIKKARLDLISAIEKKAGETGEKLSADLKKQEAVMIGVKRLGEEGATALKNQRAELEEIKLRLERIEGNMVVPIQAKLKTFDNPEDIKGIGPALGKELSGIGITSVGEFLTTDPIIIGEKTRVSQEMAENLQAMAQLMMIPGVDANDAELLIESGIKSRKELANHDLIQLSRKVGEIAKIYVDQGKISKEEYPTIEEISSWIRMAK
jgi:predicted flap endonuclease-1-like 5' DNA nuclease